MKKGPICALTSSGLKGIALLEHCSTNYEVVVPVYIQKGLRWEESELYWLKKFLRSARFKHLAPLEILHLPIRDVPHSHWSVTGVHVPGEKAKASQLFLPGRNLMLLTKAALFCAVKGIQEIAIGVAKTSPFQDADPDFLKQCESIFAKSFGHTVSIMAPLVAMRKEEIVYECRHLPLEYTFSCLNPRGYQHCSECFKCAERKKVFAKAGVTDKTHYYRKSQSILST
jgi:7-cyano-7-deazaguanine synthase